MEKITVKERGRYRILAWAKDGWFITVLFTALVGSIFFGFKLLSLLLVVGIILNFIYVIFFSKIRYKTKQGVLVIFEDSYIEKEQIELFFDNLSKKWSTVLKYEYEGRLKEELEKLRLIITKEKYRSSIFSYSNIIYTPHDSLLSKETEEIIHHYIAKKIFPSFSVSFRATIMRRFHIL